jgi:hypothetical protein
MQILFTSCFCNLPLSFNAFLYRFFFIFYSYFCLVVYFFSITYDYYTRQDLQVDSYTSFDLQGCNLSLFGIQFLILISLYWKEGTNNI